MNLAQIQDLLRLKMGLDAASVGSAAILRALNARAQAIGCDGAESYYDRLCESEAELQGLIEEVVVPETWFFRDREAFLTLARLAREEWLPAHADGTLRVLSLPCSTGEEPYSMAMALLDSGFSKNRFLIRGIDISMRAVERGRQGVYGKNSFRGDNLGFRERYFECRADGYHLNPEVRAQVALDRANIFAADMNMAGIYDVIFCRNLLIYFDRPTQDRAVGILRRLLAPDGILFVGPSETGIPAGQDFVSARIPMAFAFRKAESSAGSKEPLAKPLPAYAHKSKLTKAFVPSRSRGRTQLTEFSPPVGKEPQLAPTLARARGLADQGLLAQAAEQCGAVIGNSGPSAEAFCLLGLIHDAEGRQGEAVQSYRKAIYLDPASRDALFHLSFLLERGGKNTEAGVFRDRLLRLERRRGDPA